MLLTHLIKVHDRNRNERLWGIEACRGIAALMVVFTHISQLNAQAWQSGVVDFQTSRLLLVGRTGVDFFFVLSGFIIYYIHKVDFDKPEKLYDFTIKRISRLVPAYWICTGLFVLLTIFSPTVTGREQDITVIIRSILFIPQPDGPVIGVGWTLEHEVFFYFMFGLMIFSRKLGLIVWSIWIGVIAWRYMIGPIPHPYRYDWLGFQAQFIIGMLVAELTLRGWLRYSLIAVCIGSAGFFFGFLMEWLEVYRTNSTYGKLTFGISSGILIYGVVGMDLYRKWNVPIFLRTLGDSTYSLYLIHGMIIILMGEILEKIKLYALLHEFGSIAIVVSSCIIAAIIFTRIVEKPGIHLLRSLLEPRRSAASRSQ